MSEFIPKWHRELDIFSRIKPLIILEGNVLDVYRYPVEGSTPEGSILRLTSYLHYKLKDSGYDNIVFYDSMTGFYNNCEDGYIQKFASLIDERLNGSEIKADFSGKHGFAPFMVKTALSQNKSATAIVMNLVSRYIASPENMSQENVDSFTILLKSLLEAADVYSDKGVLKNLLILIVNKINDLPVWFYHENPNVKVINIKTPSKEEREQLLLGDNFKSFFVFEIFRDDMEYYSIKPDELEKLKNRFTALTDGFSFTEINGLRRLCKNERVRIGNLCDVVDLYKYGIRENPWRSLDVNDLKSAHDDFRKRVKGQNFALIKTLDIIKRTVTGLSGLQHSSGTKPKGVLFFAGPTGTGKTETAKTLAQKLFGDESCCIRFDMSEFSQSHSDQKLMGAPPGYVGYESGGQLTNAVKNNPFSILLFDEIEKAHPSVMDKFLQILEDGRMTDGQGNTVYFSETIIIFTSNL
ncbi:MAG: AAA family ATPase, partial [Oscillospiraceae bacterium]